MKKAFIISDGKPGHVNQSIAVAKILDYEYDIQELNYKNCVCQFVSYLFDFLNIYTDILFNKKLLNDNYKIIISAGSSTYYINKFYSRKMKIPNIAVQLPRGYKLNFSKIICPKYDKPPKCNKILETDANVSFSQPEWFLSNINSFKNRHKITKKSIGIIIGGNSSKAIILPNKLRKQIKKIFELTPDYEHWITTSRRTSLKIERIIDEFDFNFKLIYREDNFNPVPSFIHLCDYLFITSDSSSMISEAISSGKASVTIIPVFHKNKLDKFNNFIRHLVQKEFVNLLGNKLLMNNKKIDTEKIIKKELNNIN